MISQGDRRLRDWMGSRGLRGRIGGRPRPRLRRRNVGVWRLEYRRILLSSVKEDRPWQVRPSNHTHRDAQRCFSSLGWSVCSFLFRQSGKDENVTIHAFRTI